MHSHERLLVYLFIYLLFNHTHGTTQQRDSYIQYKDRERQGENNSIMGLELRTLGGCSQNFGVFNPTGELNKPRETVVYRLLYSYQVIKLFTTLCVLHDTQRRSA